jgi:hypothetical protein
MKESEEKSSIMKRLFAIDFCALRNKNAGCFSISVLASKMGGSFEI